MTHKNIKYAAAPLFNFELPTRWQIVRIGAFRIIRVRPATGRDEEPPRAVVVRMNEDPTLAPWTTTLTEGYRQIRDNTPNHMVYYFPPPRIAKNWMRTRGDLEQAEEIMNAFLLALRLRKPERVFMPSSPLIGVSIPDGDLLAIVNGRAPEETPDILYMYRPPHLLKEEQPYKFNSTDVNAVQDLFTMAEKGFRTRLAIALRRFMGSQEKEPVDLLVDLLVTLEILYGDDDPSAVGHKIAFRAATIAGRNALRREQIFKLIKKAYASRSAILHGRTTGTDLGNLPDVEEVVRHSLRWFLKQNSANGRPPAGPDIDRICFESTVVQI